jgi:hypothetical protein
VAKARSKDASTAGVRLADETPGNIADGGEAAESVDAARERATPAARD